MKKNYNHKTKLFEWQQKCLLPELRCDCGSNAQLTVDHIIPQYFLNDLGLFDEVYEDEENYEIMCRLCNKKKGSHIDPRHPKVFELLEKYIAKSKKLYGKSSA